MIPQKKQNQMSHFLQCLKPAMGLPQASQGRLKSTNMKLS